MDEELFFHQKFNKMNWWMKFDEQMIDVYQSNLKLVLVLNDNKQIPEISLLNQLITKEIPESVIQNLIIQTLSILNRFYIVQISTQFSTSTQMYSTYYNYLNRMYTINNLEIIYCFETWGKKENLSDRLKSTLLRIYYLFKNFNPQNIECTYIENIIQNWVLLFQSLQLQYQLYLKKIQSFQKKMIQEYFLVSIISEQLIKTYVLFDQMSKGDVQPTQTNIQQKINSEQQDISIIKILSTLKSEIAQNNKVIYNKLYTAQKKIEQQTQQQLDYLEKYSGTIQHQHLPNNMSQNHIQRTNYQYQKFAQYFSNLNINKKPLTSYQTYKEQNKEVDKVAQGENNNQAGLNKRYLQNMQIISERSQQELQQLSINQSEEELLYDNKQQSAVKNQTHKRFHSVNQFQLQNKFQTEVSENPGATSGSLSNRRSSLINRKDFQRMNKLFQNIEKNNISLIQIKPERTGNKSKDTTKNSLQLDIEFDQKKFSSFSNSLRETSLEQRYMNSNKQLSGKYPRSFEKIIQKLQGQDKDRLIKHDNPNQSLNKISEKQRNRNFSPQQNSQDTCKQLTEDQVNQNIQDINLNKRNQVSTKRSTLFIQSPVKRVKQIDDQLMRQLLNYDYEREQVSGIKPLLERQFTFSQDKNEKKLDDHYNIEHNTDINNSGGENINHIVNNNSYKL